MAAAALAPPLAQGPLRIELDHAAYLMDAVSSLTVDPKKSLVFYLFPILGALASSYVEMRLNDPAQAAMMPEGPKEFVLREIQNLTECAGIRRKVVPYCGLTHSFYSCGGTLSLTKPALFMPHHHIFRPGKSFFTQERAEENLSLELWNFSDDETRFFICRELGHIKKNDALLRIAIKVAIIAAVFVFYATPLGLLGGLVLFITALGLYLYSERSFQAKMDLVAVDILAIRLGNNQRRATEVAIAALRKLQRQNLDRRERNKLCRLYITKKGGANLLDFKHPLLPSRIAILNSRLAALA